MTHVESNGVGIEQAGADDWNRNVLQNVEDVNKAPYEGNDATMNMIREMDRIYERTVLLVKSIESFTQDGVDIEAVMSDIEGKEETFFSPIPDYVLKEYKRLKPANAEHYKDVSRIDTVDLFNRTANGGIERRGKDRIVIDPQVPLPMPFSKQRFDASDTRKKNMQGNYHTLFFDDGEPIVFTPPEGNKRQEIAKAAEEAAMWKRRLHRPEREVETPVRKTLKVTDDFVPSCAHVDNSSAREELRQKQEYSKVNSIKRNVFTSN